MIQDDPIGYLRQAAADFGSDVATLTERVLTYPGFAEWSGSVDHRHHYGAGGLARHTAEVVGLCMANVAVFELWSTEPVDKRALFLAAAWHDIAKVYDYEIDCPENPPCYHIWIKTRHHRLIHHVSRSAILWSQAVAETGLCKDIEEEVTHAILAHHGPHGSAIMPKTRVAWLLHLCDQLSARLDDCDRVDLRP